MLDVIGAGATARSNVDWFAAWKRSPEKVKMDAELQELLSKAGKEPVAVGSSQDREYAASFGVQMYELTRRGFLSYLRDPRYLMSKALINIIAGE